jgi:DNA repair protein RadC
MQMHRESVGPRERALAVGVGSLGDGELLAIVLGTGRPSEPVSVLSETLLAKCGGLAGLARLGPSGLAEHTGVGLAKALRLCAGIELGHRVDGLRAAPRTSLASSSEVFKYMAPRVACLEHEELWVLALDGRNGVRGARRVAQGGLHGCSVSARDILRAALSDAASAIVLVHNHPSGDPTPSPEDVAMTRVVAEAAEIVGMPLVDHVVIAGRGHTSMLDLGFLS